MVENGFYNFLNWFDGLFVIYINENVETVGAERFFLNVIHVRLIFSFGGSNVP